MTSFYGTSKVWGEISQKLEAFHLTASHPKEIGPLLERCLTEYEQQLKRVHQELENEISLLDHEIYLEKEKVKAHLKTFPEYSSLEIEQSEANLELYKHDHSIFNFIRNYFRVRHESRKIAKLREDLKDSRNEMEQPLHAKEIELEQKIAQKDELARRECQEVIAQIDFLRSISGSQELASAVAEVELQEYLGQLPGSCHVFNNINLRVDRGILFEGKWLIKAQIDQLVVTPAGLFVIEIKNWSKQFGEKGFSSDPYEQIKLAAQLCHEIIKPDFPGITVRSILAYRGHPPGYQNSGHVKALLLLDIPAYINFFTDNTLTNQALQQMVTRIQEINAT